MYDHQLFVTTISEFSRTLLSPYDATVALNDLALKVAEVLSLAGSGVTLATDGRLRFVTAVPEHLVPLEQYQEEHQRGPCVAAYESGEIVAVEDLRDREDGSWSGYCSLAHSLGMGAVAGIPMSLGEHTFGALNLYAAGTRRWPPEDLAAAAVLADMATGYLINASTYHQQEQLNEQLQRALESRIVIEQAKGVIAEARSVDVEKAFEHIRQHARSHNVKVRDVAEAIVRVGLRV